MSKQTTFSRPAVLSYISDVAEQLAHMAEENAATVCAHRLRQAVQAADELAEVELQSPSSAAASR